MKPRIRYLMIFFVLLGYGCDDRTDKIKQSESVSQKGENSHFGTWEMVYFRSIWENDTTEISGDGTPLAITLLTPTHFSYQWKNSSNSGAGTYTYDGKVIHQEFKYVQDSSFAGSILSFNMEIQNDSLIFSGPIEAKSATGEDILNQIPQMLEVRTRSK